MNILQKLKFRGGGVALSLFLATLPCLSAPLNLKYLSTKDTVKVCLGDTLDLELSSGSGLVSISLQNKKTKQNLLLAHGQNVFANGRKKLQIPNLQKGFYDIKMESSKKLLNNNFPILEVIPPAGSEGTGPVVRRYKELVKEKIKHLKSKSNQKNAKDMELLISQGEGATLCLPNLDTLKEECRHEAERSNNYGHYTLMLTDVNFHREASENKLPGLKKERFTWADLNVDTVFQSSSFTFPEKFQYTNSSGANKINGLCIESTGKIECGDPNGLIQVNFANLGTQKITIRTFDKIGIVNEQTFDWTIVKTPTFISHEGESKLDSSIIKGTYLLGNSPNSFRVKSHSKERRNK